MKTKEELIKNLASTLCELNSAMATADELDRNLIRRRRNPHVKHPDSAVIVEAALSKYLQAALELYVFVQDLENTVADLQTSVCNTIPE